MAPLIREMGEQFRAAHPDVDFDVQLGGSGRGISDARDGKVEIGMSSRDLLEEERDLHSMPVARDGIALVVHKDNPVTGLTRQQVHDVFTGAVTNWKAFGGKDATIKVIDRE